MANSFEDLFKLRFEVENAAGVLKSLEATRNAVKKLNDELKLGGKESARETTQAFRAAITAQKKELSTLKKAIADLYKLESSEAKKSLEMSRLTYKMKTKFAADEAKDLVSIKKGIEKIEADEVKKSIELARIQYSARTKFLQEEAKEKLRLNREREKSDLDAEKKSLELARLNYSSRMKFIAEQKKAEQTALSQKQKEADNQLKIAERVTNQELALYRKLEIEKAKLMAKYGQIPASFKTMPIPMDSSFKTSGSIMARQDNISTYRQNLQDAKLFSVEQNKLMQQERQRTAELKRQDAELKKQLKSQQSLSTSSNGMRKSFQGFMTSSFVFKRFFDSIIGVLDEWSKMSVAMSQFRSSANFDDVNRQLNTTVDTLGHVISKFEMIPAINKAKMLGFDFSNNKLSETLEMTTKIAQMFGMDATKAFGDFTVAISKASPIIMDNIGVLLRLEESYQMYYESQYKGTLSFEKFEQSLTQAQKRAIYYGEAMRLLQEKTEGVSVKTNEAQSVLMRLKDAWNSLGTDLEGGGGLNPLIWALEKIVSLADGVAGAFMTIQRGYKSLQYAMPSVFGTPDVGFDVKDASGIFNNRKTAIQGIKSSYGEDSLDVVNETYNKMREASVKARTDFEKYVGSLSGMLVTEENKNEASLLKKRLEESVALLDEISKKKAEGEKNGIAFITDDDVNRLSKFIPEIKDYKQYLSDVAELEKESAEYSQKAISAFSNNEMLKASGNYIASWWKDMRADSEKMAKSIGIHSTDPTFISSDLNSDKLISSQLAKKQIDELNTRIANNARLDEFDRSDYNTKKESLEKKIKLYVEEYKLTENQAKLAEKKKKIGALFAISLNDLVVGDKSQLEGDKNYIRETALLKKEFNEKYQAEDEKSRKRMLETYKVKEEDLLHHNIAMKGILNQLPEGIKNNVDVIKKAGDPLKEELWSWLTIGVKDKDELKKRADEFAPIYEEYLELVQAGAKIGLKNNIFNPFAKEIKKESSTGRTKTPKDLKTGWYELNRDLYKEILPEDAIFSKTEDARLELFQKQLDLEKLKKDIAKTQSEGGKVDRNINAKFQEEQKYVEMLTKKYEQVVELANEEYRILMLQQTARQRATYEFKVEKTTDYLTPGNTQITKQGAKLNQYKLNELNQEQAIIENEIAREAAISEEKKRISLGLQNKLTQSAKEYNDTSLFAKASEKITLEYKQKEADIVKQINKDYAELLNGKLLKINKNQKEFNDLLSAQANSWLQMNGLYEKFGRRQAEITEDFKPGKRQAEKQKRTSFWTMDAFYGIGSAFGGLSEDEELYREQKAHDEMKKMYDLYRNKGTSTTKKYGITETMFEKGLDTKGNYDQTGLETYLKTLNMTEAEIKNIQSTFEEMSGGIKSAGQRMIEDMQQVADAWKNIWQDTYRDIANVFGQGLWDSIVNTSGEALWQYQDQRKESLTEEKKNLEQGQITKEQYLNRAAIIEKNFDTQKRNLEKQSTKETLKNLGSMFFFKGLGYLIEAPIKAFEGNMAAAAAYAGAGSALMLLGAGLGYASRGYRPSQTSSFEDEASAKQQDTNIYIDNRLFEDKRQMQKLYQSSLDMEV